MLHRLHTIDYGSRKAGSSAADNTEKYHPRFFLDYLSIVGLPLKPITRANGDFFDNVTITFKDWHVPYPAKHQFKMPFDLTHRTFRLATAGTRETWYVVMHPIVAPAMELLSRRKRLEKQKRSSQASALETHHAQALASYIKRVFDLADFASERVEQSWTLGGARSQPMTGNQWTTFQERFVEGWADHVTRHAYDPFWEANQPCFHVEDHGANIKIEVSEAVERLMPETRVRPDEEGDSDGEGAAAASDADGDADPLFVDDWRSSQPPGPSPVPATQDDWRLHLSSTDDLFSGGLRRLAVALDGKYDVDHISGMAYALAVNLNSRDPADPTGRATWCLLGDRNAVRREYGASGASGMTFYPLAFHPAYGNFTSPKPPRFLQDHVLAVMKDNMSYQNDGASVLSCEYFQGYSGIKPAIRYNPEDLLVTQGTATAALTLPAAEAMRTAKVKLTQHGLLKRLRGDPRLEDPDASRPFARERQRIERAVATNEFGFRMEQVICVDVAALKPRWRHIQTVLRPIFQLMRFYLRDSKVYAPLMRRFRPEVFPGILAAYARVFDLAMQEMLKRFQAQGSKGLGVALAEGVAALDRLGHYCFTGSPQVLMRSVLGPLKTMESLAQCGWPYLDPQLLDIRQGEGLLNIARWPRAADGRPIFMHIASLGFHYGAAVAASRQSVLWFRDLGGRSIGGSLTVTAFLEELFRELWVPQMVAFVRFQVLRRLSTAPTDEMLLSGALDDVEDDMGRRQQQRDTVEAWAKADHPFAWSQYEPIWRMLALGGAQEVAPHKSRHDFAREMYTGCRANDSAVRQALSSKHSTWFPVLHAVLTFTPVARVSEDRWQSGLRAALEENHIECMPGSNRSCLTARRVVRLAGNTVPPSRSLAARPESLKRQAIEAVFRVEEKRRRQTPRLVIDLGGDIPFRRIPKLVREGFASLLKPSKVRDEKVAEHYQAARNCLVECLGDPLCDLMLMLAVTYGSSSKTPIVEERGKGFAAGKDTKEQGQFAACLVTRMLWFFRPDAFPWKEDDGLVLRVPEMTKKIEHKGVNNRFLCEAGWVVTAVARPSPRNTEVRLRAVEELQEYYQELLRRRTKPNQFIARVFRSRGEQEEAEWVERCAGIIREQS
ncbi:MAG TPA: hypothetical protein VGM86_35710 [Thermoanaerobaculia bacterium]